MKRLLIVALATTLSALLSPTPAQGGNYYYDSLAHVWNRDDNLSTSSSGKFVFPANYDCPDSFRVRMSWLKWRYTSPEGPTVRLKKLSLRLKPNHRMRVTIDGQNRWFPADSYTTRHYEIDTSADVPLLDWDSNGEVGVGLGRPDQYGTSTYYAPNYFGDGIAGACKRPEHMAVLRRHW